MLYLSDRFERLASVDFFLLSDATWVKTLSIYITREDCNPALHAIYTVIYCASSKQVFAISCLFCNFKALFSFKKPSPVFRLNLQGSHSSGKDQVEKKFFKIREFYFDWGKNEFLKNESRVKLDGNDNTADVILMKAGRNISGQLLVIPTMFPLKSENCWKLIKLNGRF